jgi:hypothetical protein
MQEREQTLEEKQAELRLRRINDYRLELVHAWRTGTRCVGFGEVMADFLFQDPASWNRVLELERQYACILDRKSKPSSQTPEPEIGYEQNEPRKQHEEEEEEVRRITPWNKRCVNLTSREKHSRLPA